MAGDDLSQETKNIVLSLLIITTVIVALRLWGRLCVQKGLGADDAFIVLSWALLVGMGSVTLSAVNHGLGRHKADVSSEGVIMVLKLDTAISPLYTWAILTAKASFCALYLRLLPTTWLRYLNKGLMVFFLCQAIEESLIPVLKCQPISATWDPKPGSKCLSLVPLWWSTFAFNFTTDILLFVQPIPSMWGLNLPLVKRLGLIAMLSLGLLVTAISIIRMVYANRISADLTYALAAPIAWCYVEVSALIICSCIPPLRAVISTIPGLNSALGLSSGRDTSGNYQHSAANKSGAMGASIQLQSRDQKHSKTKTGHRVSRFGMVSHAEALSSEEEILSQRQGSDQKPGIMVTHQVVHDIESREDSTVDSASESGHNEMASDLDLRPDLRASPCGPRKDAILSSSLGTGSSLPKAT